MMRRSAVAAVLASCLALLGPDTPASAKGGKSGTFGEYVKAARMFTDWRYDEAREQVARLVKRWPNAAETHYLQAELAFIEGSYDSALEHLDGLKDGDVQGQVGRLRRLLASTIVATQGFTKRTSKGGHFVIWYPPGKDEVIVDLAGDVLEKAYARLGEDFGYRPSETIRVELLSAPSDLAKVSSLTESEIRTTGTIALCKYGKLMVVTPRATLRGYPWMDTLVHEYVHYLVSRLSHDRVPVWLHEGLARFEQSRWRAQPSTKLTVTDEHLLATALKKRKLIRFKDMHPSMAKLPSAEAASLAFAEVYTMVGYVHDKVGYPGIRQIIAKTRAGKSARRAVSEVLGSRWPSVERAWKKYLRARKLKTSRTFAGRAKGPRVRFSTGQNKGGKDLDNVGSDEVENKKARKFTRLAGLLRSRGLSEAAAIEYEKALQAAPGDPFIAGKLSRTHLELQNFARSIELARPLADADEDDPVAATTLGVAYGATGNLAQSAHFFEIALRVSPFDPRVRCGLADAYAELAKPDLSKREHKACNTLRNETR